MADFVSAARMFLAAQAPVHNVLDNDENWDLWLFQENLYVRVESTQKTACVLKQATGWTAPNAHNTMRFPRLQTVFYADPDRDDSNNTSTPLSAKDKIRAAHEVVDSYLHDTAGKYEWWPDRLTYGAVRVLRSVRQGELEFFPEVDGDGMQRASVFYALGLG